MFVSCSRVFFVLTFSLMKLETSRHSCLDSMFSVTKQMVFSTVVLTRVLHRMHSNPFVSSITGAKMQPNGVRCWPVRPRAIAFKGKRYRCWEPMLCFEVTLCAHEHEHEHGPEWPYKALNGLIRALYGPWGPHTALKALMGPFYGGHPQAFMGDIPRPHTAL